MRKIDTVNLRLRTISALILAPIVLVIIYAGRSSYVGFTAVMITIALYEWVQIVFAPDKNHVKPKSLFWLICGTVYLTFSGIALVYLRMLPGIGLGLTYYLFAVVWGTDIGAYVFGKLIGGPKLAKVISPKKTWAGLFGGMALAALFSYGTAVALGAKRPLTALGFAILLAMIAQAGDLLKSFFKRRAGVKDSGVVIPGHGGVLDRIDGLIFAAVVFAIFETAIGLSLAWW